MSFRKNVFRIMSYNYWKKGSCWTYPQLRKIIIEQLEVTDRRTISKWIGKIKIIYESKRVGLYQSSKVKTTVWQKGLLEEFWIIERMWDDTFKEWKFKVLKDNSDF